MKVYTTKKAISIFLAAILLLSLLAACGAPAPSSAPKNSPKNYSSPAYNDSTDGDVTSDDTDAAANQATPAAIDNKWMDTTIEKTTLVDDGNITIIANELSFTDTEVVLKLSVENHYDERLEIYATPVAINNCSKSLTYAINILPFEKSDWDIAISNDFLETIKLEYISQISIKFAINTPYIGGNSYDRWYDTSIIEIPTSKISLFSSSGIDGHVYFDEENIKLAAYGKFYNNSFGGFQLNIYIENNNDYEMLISSKEFYINGVKFKGNFMEVLPPKIKIFTWYSFTADEKNVHGISADEITTFFIDIKLEKEGAYGFTYFYKDKIYLNWDR